MENNFTADLLKELEEWRRRQGYGIGSSDVAQLATAIALSRIADALQKTDRKTVADNGE